MQSNRLNVNALQIADVDAISQPYQHQYKQMIANAIGNYLNWMNVNAQGTRLFGRFSHWHHGSSGKQRAEELRRIINAPNSFYAIVYSVAKAISASSDAEHSLKRYIYQAMRNEQVVDAQPAMSAKDFLHIANASINVELMNVSNPNAPPPYLLSPAPTSGAEVLLPWSLTTLVKNAPQLYRESDNYLYAAGAVLQLAVMVAAQSPMPGVGGGYGRHGFHHQHHHGGQTGPSAGGGGHHHQHGHRH